MKETQEKDQQQQEQGRGNGSLPPLEEKRNRPLSALEETRNRSLSPGTEPAEIDYSGLPKINLGALFMPAVWGPAHGQWISILFYPLWLFADTSITNAVLFGGFTYALAASVILGTAALTIFYARTVGYKAYARVAHKVTKEQYLARERKWAVASLLIALIFVGFATWYNLTIRLPQGLI